jgi:hypothetical protein
LTEFLEVRAEVVAARSALAVGHVGDARLQRHPICDLVLGGLVAQGHHRLHRFMAQDQGFLNHEGSDAALLIVVYVGAADADGLYLDQYVVRSRLGQWFVFEPNIVPYMRPPCCASLLPSQAVFAGAFRRDRESGLSPDGRSPSSLLPCGAHSRHLQTF